MKYKIRDGIVMETVCGTSLLIATLAARKYCPYVMRLNEASAYIWNMLFAGMERDEMIDSIVRDFRISRKEAGTVLNDFIGQLYELHYLLDEKEI